MRHPNRIVSLILAVALLLSLPGSPATGQTPRAELLKRSSIVFVGTVEQAGAASFAGVPVSRRTGIVRVDVVLDKPPSVHLMPGDRVTVEAKDPSLLRRGVRATFYTDGWIFGEGVAVREVGHEILPAALEAAAASKKQAEVSQIRKELSDAELRARIQTADLVVVGRVVRVQPAAMSAQPGRTTRITEHDPAWQEAVIRVVAGIKGAQANQEIVVRFPGTLDVAWHGVPKFTKDQEGTFILQKDRVTGTPKAILAGTLVDAYTALDLLSVLPKEQADRVRSLTRP